MRELQHRPALEDGYVERLGEVPTGLGALEEFPKVHDHDRTDEDPQDREGADLAGFVEDRGVEEALHRVRASARTTLHKVTSTGARRFLM